MLSRSRTKEVRDEAQKLADDAYREFWTSVVECSEILQEIAPNQRKKLSLVSVLIDLHREQNGLCPLCGESLVLGGHEVDHIIPFCYGGGNERANIQLAHPKCNKSKGKQVDPHDLLRYLEDRYVNL